MEINGIEYEAIPQPKNNKISGFAFEMLLISSIYGFPSWNGKTSNPKRKPSTRGLAKEFELIQQKKSDLSRSERKWVVKEFNKQFRIKEPTL